MEYIIKILEKAKDDLEFKTYQYNKMVGNDNNPIQKNNKKHIWAIIKEIEILKRKLKKESCL